MYEENFLINYGIIYDTGYGCIKQHICANALYILSVLEFTYRVIIDRLINYPVNERSKLYGINGSYKLYFRQKIYMIGTEEANN